MRGAIRTILLASTATIAAVTALPSAAHALDAPPRVTYFNRLSVPDSMAARVRAAYGRHSAAMDACDMQAAQAALDELDRLVREARRVAQAARAAGDLAAINADDAEEDHNIARGHLHHARVRHAAGCRPPQATQRHRLVNDAAARLERARAAAAACDRAALEAAIVELETISVDATANYDWRGTTWEDMKAIDEMAAEARDLRSRCGTPPPPPPAPPPPPPSQSSSVPLSPQEEARAGEQARTIGAIETLIANAEAARLRGDCVTFRGLIDQAERDLEGTDYTTVPLDTHASLSRQIREVKARICLRPPATPATGAPPEDGPQPGADVLWGDYFYAAGGYGEINLPRVNYGFQRDGSPGSAPERPAGFSAREIGVNLFSGAINLTTIGEFIAEYRTGSERTAFDVGVLASSGASGIINTAESPSGSTGVTANFGVTGQTRTSVDDYFFAYRRTFKSTRVRPTPEPGSLAGFRIFAGLMAHAGRRDHDASLNMSGTTGGGFQFEVNQQLDQRVDSFRVGGGLGAEVLIPVGPRVTIQLGGEGNVFYYNFDLRSLETRTQNIGPSSDQSFENRIEDERSGAGWRGVLWGGIAFRMSERLSIGVTGSVQHLSHVAQVVNPESGDAVLAGVTSRLATDDAFSWGISLSLRMELAGRHSSFR